MGFEIKTAEPVRLESQIRFVCPACKSTLSSRDELFCLNCRTSYPRVMGIPDFRGPRTEDWILWDRKMAAALVQHYPKLSFEALVRMRFKGASDVPSAIFEYHLSHELNYSEKGSNRKFRIVRLLGGQRYEGLSKGKCLDLGCGSGSSLVAIAEDFQLGLGVDVLMQDLILGKKYAEEAGIKNVHYTCAFGENLPFEPETFDFVNATDTIEHIENAQSAFLREVKRVLKSGGVFCFNSPNRFNLFTPEPHVKIWGLGFLPRAWMDPACRMIKGVAYRGKRLLSYFELKNILKKTFGRRFFITGLTIDPSQAKKRLIGKLFSSFPFTLKVLNKVFRYVLTNYQVVAFKGDSNNSFSVSNS